MTQQTLSKVLKAVFAAATALLSQLSTVLIGKTTVENITQGQWSNIAFWTLVAFGGAFGLAAWAGPRVNGGKAP